MAEEEQVSGGGWISDDSSLYGDEDEQERLHSTSGETDLGCFGPSQKTDLNSILVRTRAQSRRAIMLPTKASPHRTEVSSARNGMAVQLQADGTASNFLLDRRAMEEARLARLGKRKREPSPEPALFNPAQGCPDAWQLGESVDDFVGRLPPVTTPIFTCPWIWIHNPHRDLRDKALSPREDEFRVRGRSLLDRSLQTRQQNQAKLMHGSKAVLHKSLNQESKALQQSIADLAAECGILSGKWMLFPSQTDVTRVWKRVVEGVIDNRLGSTAKVATDEGNQGDRLICIYTKVFYSPHDFRDENDVVRVLQELDTMGLLPSGRPIYYKSDAFTHLDLYKETAAEYGLQASLYTSTKLMAAAKISKATSSAKQRPTLNQYF
ncbi:DUF1917-domain-containing protein [Setomelanomma holmii]|uniref:DUF1917-domain-containing protein n=1 Tax=Setomelanomma holmii TaxID=210430 RepID=A0A9P4LPU4_9PLEO|nr:DUF1917-domain-containing protein [Setomelanomma holmii]